MQRPLADSRPFGPFVSQSANAEERLVAELENVVGSEESAREEYEGVIRLLRERGFDSEAEVVEDIMEDEIRHREELMNILSTVRRRTSF